MKKTPLKRRTPLRAKKSPSKSRKPLKRSPLRKKGKSELSKAKAKLWELCKAITRKKYGNTCYTCGKTGLEGSNWHTGHYITKSICSGAIAHDLRNLRPQCYRCNINLSGNWVSFDKRMKEDEGEEFTEALKKENEETKGLKYDTHYYLTRIDEYTVILEELEFSTSTS